MAEKEYISRNALIAAYDAAHKGLPGGARKLMVDAPAADVVEVKHGEWIKHPCSYECTVCNGEFFVESYAKYYDPVTDYDLHFCPNCGAKMDGERKEQE
jgi:hypothetical protein